MWVQGKTSWSDGKCKCIFSGVKTYKFSQPPIFFIVTKRIANLPIVKIENWIISVLTTAERPPR